MRQVRGRVLVKQDSPILWMVWVASWRTSGQRRSMLHTHVALVVPFFSPSTYTSKWSKPSPPATSGAIPNSGRAHASKSQAARSCVEQLASSWTRALPGEKYGNSGVKRVLTASTTSDRLEKLFNPIGLKEAADWLTAMFGYVFCWISTLVASRMRLGNDHYVALIERHACCPSFRWCFQKIVICVIDAPMIKR
jgi:hypothetical protein